MPNLAPPALHKPKSKLRLRLGFTQSQPKPTEPSSSNLPHSSTAQSRVVSAKQPIETQSADSQNIVTPSSSTLDLAKLDIRSSDSSLLTITSLDASSRASLLSGPDSHSAFTYDNSPSTNSQSGHTGPSHATTGAPRAFDTISYASASPASVVFARSPSDELVHAPHSQSQSNIPTPFRKDWRPKFESKEQFERQYPNIAAAASASDDIFHITDEQLADRFWFVRELGFGNWGTVWLCRPWHARHSVLRGGIYGEKEALLYRKMGKAAYASGGAGAGGRVALKLVYREKAPTTAARVRALWGEMKIIRSLRQEPHPSIINFEAFIVCPSYAIVIMPCLRALIPLGLPAHIATPYLRQLASAVGYLHERGITHNDIKPANVMLSHSDIPVLVDFGFANQYDIHDKSCFLSTLAWGTPEYLDPQRARAQPHDERASDVWALGVTMYEILIGRTPFEIREDEEFEEDYTEYYQRTCQGEWLGEWDMPEVHHHLLRHMICPDPAYRISAVQAYHHVALQPVAPSVIVTPHFIRAAATWDEEEEEAVPLPAAPIATEPVQDDTTRRADVEKKKRRKKDGVKHTRTATPTALGESIKQHTSAPRTKVAASDKRDGAENEMPSPTKSKGSRLMIKPLGGGDEENKGIEEDPTPTKVLKPAKPLRINQLAQIGDNKAVPRTSQSQTATLSRPTSTASLDSHVKRESGTLPTSATASTAATAGAASTTKTLKMQPSARNLRTVQSIVKLNLRDSSGKTDSMAASNGHRDSTMSFASATSAPKTKEEAVLKTMRSLEGGALKAKRDVLSKITRPAPEPPRPTSSDSIESTYSKGEQRRSLGIVQTLESVEESDTTADQQFKDAPIAETTLRRSVPLLDRPEVMAAASPPRKRLAAPPIDATGSPGRTASIPFGPIFKPSSPALVKVTSHIRPLSTAQVEEELIDEVFDTPLPALSGIVKVQAEKKSAEPKVSMETLRDSILSIDQANVLRFRKSTENLVTSDTASAPPRKSEEALAIDSRLDKISEWAKSVEKIVEDARKALEEGREVPSLPNLVLPPEATSPYIAPFIAASLAQLQPLVSAAPPPLQSITTAGAVTTSAIAASSPLANNATETREAKEEESRHSRQFGVTPNRLSSLPAHLRTSSVQVEPATPPKWMTYAEAEAQIKAANTTWEAAHGGARRAKKERPGVGHLLNLFSEKDKKENRTSTPEPNLLVPLKPPAHALRGAPSTPALRNSISSNRKLPFRKSESNLRNYNTLPTLVSLADIVREGNDDELLDNLMDEHDAPVGSPAGSTRRGLYERFLDSTPGVVRSGEGWGSLSSGRAMAKPSSVLSLREKARAWMSSGGAVTSGAAGAEGTADNAPRRNSRSTFLSNTIGHESGISFARPATPGAASVLTMGTATGTVQGAGQGAMGSQGRKGIWKGLKGLGRKRE